MATTELTIRQLADEGGTTPIAPVTVTDAVLKGDGTTLTEELTALNNGLFIRKSNTISVNVSSGAGGTVNYSYPTAMPAGYEPISRCFMRTDAGGYGVIVVCPLYQNYINYYSTGSAPNPMTGYVVELCAKTNMYR